MRDMRTGISLAINIPIPQMVTGSALTTLVMLMVLGLTLLRELLVHGKESLVTMVDSRLPSGLLLFLLLLAVALLVGAITLLNGIP